MALDKSIRQQILEAMVAAFQGVQPPPAQPGRTPLDSDWPFSFSNVAIGPLTAADQKRRYTIGIVPGVENETFKFPFVYVQLAVAVEFRITVNKGDPPSGETAEQVYTVVKRVLMLDETWGGLAIDTTPNGGDIDLDTQLDRSIVGVRNVTIQYRYSAKDPRDPTGAYA